MRFPRTKIFLQQKSELWYVCTSGNETKGSAYLIDPFSVHDGLTNQTLQHLDTTVQHKQMIKCDGPSKDSNDSTVDFFV